MQVVLFMGTTCVLVYMSGLVCMCNDPAHTSRHSQFISLSLWQHHGGCCSLPLGEIRVMCWGSLARKCAVRCLIPQRCSSFRDSEVAKKVPRRRKWNGDTAVNQLLEQGPTSIHWPKSPSMIRCAHHLKKRGEENKKSDAAELPQTNSILLS